MRSEMIDNAKEIGEGFGLAEINARTFPRSSDSKLTWLQQFHIQSVVHWLKLDAWSKLVLSSIERYDEGMKAVANKQMEYEELKNLHFELKEIYSARGYFNFSRRN